MLGSLPIRQNQVKSERNGKPVVCTEMTRAPFTDVYKLNRASSASSVSKRIAIFSRGM